MKKNKWNLYRVLVVAVCIQFLGLVVVNFTQSYDLLDYDSALALRHALEMWKHGIFLPDFVYFSTMEIDGAAFWAAPLYAVTKNLNLSLGIVHVALYLCVVTIIYDLFKNLKYSREAFLIAVLVFFTPYGVGQLDWANMLFISAGQYIFRVMVMLLLIDLMIMLEQKRQMNKKFFLMLVVFCILNFWTSLSTGNYVLLMIVLPAIIKVFIDGIMEQEAKSKIPLMFFLLLSCVVSVVGWGMHNYFVGVSDRNSLCLIPSNRLFENIQNCLVGIILLFRGIPHSGDISIFSFTGMAYIVRLIFSIFCLAYCWIGFVCKEKREKNNAFSKYFLVYALIHLFVLMVTDSQYGSPVFEQRYHILWCVLMLLFISSTIQQKKRYQNNWLEICVVYGFLGLLVLINGSGFARVFTAGEEKNNEAQIIEWARELQVETIYIYDDIDTANIIRALVPDMYCIETKYIDGSVVMTVGDFYRDYGDRGHAQNTNMLVCNPDELKNLPIYMQDEYTPVAELENGDNLYYADENYWDGAVGFPTENSSKSIDFPYSNGYSFSGFVTEEGKVLLNGDENLALSSPELMALRGNYDIELKHKVIQKGVSDSVFRIMNNTDGAILAEMVLSNDIDRNISQTYLSIPDNRNIVIQIHKDPQAVIEVEGIWINKRE